MRSLDGSGVNREVHAPFCERLGVQFPRPTCHQLHWLLDVGFGEDGCMNRKDHAPQNLSLIKKIVLNLIRLDKTDTVKTSLRLKRKRAAWDDDIRMKMLGLRPL